MDQDRKREELLEVRREIDSDSPGREQWMDFGNDLNIRVDLKQAMAIMQQEHAREVGYLNAMLTRAFLTTAVAGNPWVAEEEARDLIHARLPADLKHPEKAARNRLRQLVARGFAVRSWDKKNNQYVLQLRNQRKAFPGEGPEASALIAANEAFDRQSVTLICYLISLFDDGKERTRFGKQQISRCSYAVQKQAERKYGTVVLPRFVTKEIPGRRSIDTVHGRAWQIANRYVATGLECRQLRLGNEVKPVQPWYDATEIDYDIRGRFSLYRITHDLYGMVEILVEIT